MIWNNFADRLAVTSRRKCLTTALVYGLSLSVRFTSATGEEMEIPAHSSQRAHPMISIMTRNDAQLPYQDWGSKPAQPIVFRHGWSPSSATLGCLPP
jgi:hypothetical protein